MRLGKNKSALKMRVAKRKGANRGENEGTWGQSAWQMHKVCNNATRGSSLLLPLPLVVRSKASNNKNNNNNNRNENKMNVSYDFWQFHTRSPNARKGKPKRISIFITTERTKQSKRNQHKHTHTHSYTQPLHDEQIFEIISFCFPNTSIHTNTHTHTTFIHTLVTKRYETFGCQHRYVVACGIATFSCPAGYKVSGSTCVNENECLLFPCRNGGRCRDHHPPKKYECSCSLGYTGMHCELELLASGVLTPSRDFIIALVLCLSTLIRKYTFLLFLYVPVYLSKRSSLTRVHREWA